MRNFNNYLISRIIINAYHIVVLYIQPTKKKNLRWIPFARMGPISNIPPPPPPRPNVPPPPPPMYDSNAIDTVFDPNDFKGGLDYEPYYGNLDYGYEVAKNGRGGYERGYGREVYGKNRRGGVVGHRMM